MCVCVRVRVCTRARVCVRVSVRAPLTVGPQYRDALGQGLRRLAHVGPGVLVRLAHLFETGEDAAMSEPVSIDLSSLLAPQFAQLQACEEFTLPGAKPVASVQQRSIMVAGEGVNTYPTLPVAPAGTSQTIVLEPLQIRTFLCTC